MNLISFILTTSKGIFELVANDEETAIGLFRCMNHTEDIAIEDVKKCIYKGIEEVIV